MIRVKKDSRKKIFYKRNKDLYGDYEESIVKTLTIDRRFSIGYRSQ